MGGYQAADVHGQGDGGEAVEEEKPLGRPTKVRLKIIEGKALFPEEKPEGCEPYAVVHFGDAEVEALTTEHAKKSQDPRWNHEETIEVPSGAEVFEVNIWDEDD